MNPTQEEILNYLGRWKHCSQADQCPPEEMKRCIEAEESIRSLIVAFGRWQKILREANEMTLFVITPRLLEEIRDFGEKK